MQSAGQRVVLSTRIPGWEPRARGKVRDLYDLGDRLLLVATDRISAFDVVLPTGIPDKGRVLNQLSAFWFEELRELCPNHYLSIDTTDVVEALGTRGEPVPVEQLAGRSMLCRMTSPLPVECVVRGYLEGSAWKEYRRSRSVCGIPLPEGLLQGSRLPEPLFTPSTKAETGHDQNITKEEMVALIGEDLAERVIRLSLAIYGAAAEHAHARGILIADTKFEFGIAGGELLMIDECLTPDSSRFWEAERWEPGGPQPSYDKQFVRDYLDSVGWNHEPPAPELPDGVVAGTAERYREIHRRLTGRELV